MDDYLNAQLSLLPNNIFLCLQGVFGFDDKQATVASGGTFLSLLNHCYEALENMVSVTGSLYKVNVMSKYYALMIIPIC